MRREVLNWLAEAEADLKRAERAFRDGDYALSAYMSQQTCEKAFKAAYLCIERKIYPRTHDLVVLYTGLSNHLNLPKDVAERLPEISQYYVIVSYPNVGLERPSEEVSREMASRGIDVARATMEVVRGALQGRDP